MRSSAQAGLWTYTFAQSSIISSSACPLTTSCACLPTVSSDTCAQAWRELNLHARRVRDPSGQYSYLTFPHEARRTHDARNLDDPFTARARSG